MSAAVRERFGIDAPVFAAALSLDALPAIRAVARASAAAALPVRAARHGVLDRRSRADAWRRCRRPSAARPGRCCARSTVFDVFRLPDGARSVAWRLTFQAEDRTLTDDEVNAIHARVAGQVSREFGITLRGS